MTANFGYTQQLPTDQGSEFNKIRFIIKQMINRMSTMKLVQVNAVHSNGALAAAGTVDVQLLVSQVDGQFNATAHGIVYGIPWYRLQGGKNAVICDPQVGDVGYVTVSDRDISALKSAIGTSGASGTVNPSAPGTWRKYNIADGIYVGGCLNQVPNQYIQFTSTGIVIADNNGNQIQFSNLGITLVGNVIMQNNLQLAGNIQGSNAGSTYAGDIHTSGAIVAKFGTGSSVGLTTHTHNQGVDSRGDTEQPVQAPNAGT